MLPCGQSKGKHDQVQDAQVYKTQDTGAHNSFATLVQITEKKSFPEIFKRGSLTS